MRQSLSLACLGLLLAASAGGAHAGPSLESLLERERPMDDLPDPSPGLEAAPGGPGADAPWLAPGGAPQRLRAHLVSPTQSAGRLRVRAGFAWRDEPSEARRWTLDGSVVAYELAGSAEVYASVERRHWGPGWLGSLILDGAAPALPAVGWRKADASASSWPVLRWLGPWSADVFIGRLRGHDEPERPLLVGARVQLEPSRTLQIGFSRTMQWGGRGRDESLRSLADAVLGRDNVEPGPGRASEPGNQLAGVDARWTPREGGPSLYGQIVGEDEAGMLPSANMLMLGADLPLTWGGHRVRAFAEALDTRAGLLSGHYKAGAAYRHHAYRDGYTHEGVLIGHPAGGDVALVSVGALVRRGPAGGLLALSAGRAADASQRFQPGSVRGVNASAHLDVERDHRVGLGGWWWRDAAGPRGELQVWWQHAIR